MRKKNWPPKQDSPENRELAFNYSLKYLSFRARSVKEVYDYLSRKNFVEDTINSVLKRLIDLKFLNDKQFAEDWTRSRQKYKNKSKFIIKTELRLKGVNDETIQETLNDATDDFESAKILFEKKKRLLGKLPALEFKKKMSGFLYRRGYSFETINKLFREN